VARLSKTQEEHEEVKEQMVMSMQGQPDRLKRKNILVNTLHCRQELDTI
jgi:hypothetical protein